VAYATLEQVIARAGALSSAWDDNSLPSLGDIVQFLADVSSEIDALLGARGLTAPAGSTAALALAPLNADGALVVALQATFPETRGPAAATQTIAGAQARYEEGMAALLDGSHPALALLEAGNVAARASSFWENEPLYGLIPGDPDTLTPFSKDGNPNTAPAFARGQGL
jgi:hypothetical protein